MNISNSSDFDTVGDQLGRKFDFSHKSPQNRITHSTGRKKRPSSKNQNKRNSTTLHRKKPSTRAGSSRRDELFKHYLGNVTKIDAFINQPKHKTSGGGGGKKIPKLNRSFHFSKPSYSSQAPTPQLK